MCRNEWDINIPAGKPLCALAGDLRSSLIDANPSIVVIFVLIMIIISTVEIAIAIAILVDLF
jgi:hypothetical protein